MKIYDEDACRRKASEHWEMAGQARQDRDAEDEREHTRLAQLWDQRAKEGGHQE